MARRLERLGRLACHDPFGCICKRLNKRPHSIAVLFLAHVVHQAYIALLDRTCISELKKCCYLAGYGAFGVIGSSTEDIGVVVRWREVLVRFSRLS